MHSRIFQVSKNKITKDNLIKEYRYNDYFVGKVADYVVDSENKKADLEWLTSCNKGLELMVEDNCYKLKVVSKAEYFEKKFEDFQENIEKLSNYSLEDFMDNSKWLDMYHLKDNYDNEYGFYIDDNDEYFGIATFDHFMRNAEDGDVYYIGNTFDYHF